MSSNGAAHRWNNSDEIDVFEAARYFSSGINSIGVGDGVGYRRAMREESGGWKAERKSLDMAMKAILPQRIQKVGDYNEEKKCNQPISHVGRLARFLSSLFHQVASKKKLKSFTNDVGEESKVRRKRRSNKSHSQSIRSSDSKSICSHKLITFIPQREVWDDQRVIDQPWLAEFIDESLGKSKIVESGWLERGARLHGIRFVRGENRWVLKKNDVGFMKDNDVAWSDELTSKENNFGKDDDEGDEEGDKGWESDSSSDLFELKNYELGDLSSGLPIYRTTDQEIVEMEATIASVTF